MEKDLALRGDTGWFLDIFKPYSLKYALNFTNAEEDLPCNHPSPLAAPSTLARAHTHTHTHTHTHSHALTGVPGS